MPKFTISILSFDNFQMLAQCILSVMNHSHDYEIIATDNGSSDQTGRYLDELHRAYPHIVRVIRNDRNLGFIQPNRAALQLALGTYFVTLNDDTLVPPGWLDKLEAPFRADDQCAVVGTKDGCTELLPNFWGHHGKRVEYVQGSCMMIPVAIAREHGLFSDYLQFACCEDSDLCLRLREKGYRITVADLSIRHLGGFTMKRVPEAAIYFQRNLATCQRVWKDYLASTDRKFPAEA